MVSLTRASCRITSLSRRGARVTLGRVSGPCAPVEDKEWIGVRRAVQFCSHRRRGLACASRCDSRVLARLRNIASGHRYLDGAGCFRRVHFNQQAAAAIPG
jgi:hypothetical protein